MKKRNKFVRWINGHKVWVNERMRRVYPTHWKKQAAVLAIGKGGY